MMATAPQPPTRAATRPLPRLTLLIRDLGYGGAQRQLVTLARMLHARAFEVSLVHFYSGPLAAELDKAGIARFLVPKRGRWDLPRFFVRLRRALRLSRPDVLHSYLTESNVMASLCRGACGDPAVVWGIRDSESDAHQWGLLGRASASLARRLSHRADALIANSYAGREWYLRHGYPVGRFSVVPNGIDVERFNAAPRTPAARALRDAWSATADTILLGCIGRLNAMKDHRTLLQAVALVAAENPQLRLAIIGHGDEALGTELRLLADQLGLTDRVYWSPARDDMPTVFSALDGVVSSSSFGEGFSNVLGEAMATGRPCIATDVGDAALLLGDTGFLCPPRDPAALAAGLQSLLAMTSTQRTDLGLRARQRIVERFTPEHLADRTTELLTSLCLR